VDASIVEEAAADLSAGAEGVVGAMLRDEDAARNDAVNWRMEDVLSTMMQNATTLQNI
jgi:hypothetical protein